MRGQVLSLKIIDLRDPVRLKLYVDDMKITVQSEPGYLGAHPVSVISIDESMMGNLRENFTWRNFVEIPEHIATFIQRSVEAETERAARVAQKLDATPFLYAGDGQVRDLSAVFLQTPLMAELGREQNKIGRELHALLANSRGS